MSEPSEHAKRKADYERTFGSDHGKRVLDDLFRITEAGRSSFRPGIDAIGMAFQEGKREVWLYVQRALDHDEDRVRRLVASGKETSS